MDNLRINTTIYRVNAKGIYKEKSDLREKVQDVKYKMGSREITKVCKKGLKEKLRQKEP